VDTPTKNRPFAKTRPFTRTEPIRPDLDAKIRNTTPNRPTISNPYRLSSEDRAELAKKGPYIICKCPDYRTTGCN